MPLWYTGPLQFTPKSIDGLVGWYDSNSAMFNTNNTMIRWNDNSFFRNDLVPIVSNVDRSFLFNNTVLKNESQLSLQTISSGADIFIVANISDLSNNEFDNSNFVSFFTNSIETPTTTENLTTGVSYNSLVKNRYLTVGNLFNHNTIQSSPIDSNILNKKIIIHTYGPQPNSYGDIVYNGTTRYTESTVPSQITTSFSNFNVFIGDHTYYGPDSAYHGIHTYIYEVLLYNKVLSTENSSSIINYLADKHTISVV